MPAEGPASPHPGSVGAIVLAAGRGVRMASRRPKVLHPVGGVPMLQRVLAAVGRAGVDEIVLCIFPNAGEIKAAAQATLPKEEKGSALQFAVQPRPLGTGDAVRVSLGKLPARVQTVIVIGADTPLTSPETLREVARQRGDAAIAVAVAELDDPHGYGRVIRDDTGAVERIVEEADATAAERALPLAFGWPMAFDRGWLETALAGLRPAPNGELYLTQLIGDAVKAGRGVRAVEVADQWDIVGVNSQRDLARVEAALRERVCNRLLDAGVTIIDPATTYVEEQVVVGQDVVLHPQTYLSGQTVIGDGCELGPAAEIIDSRLEGNVRVWWSVVEGAQIAQGVRVGPYCRVRPGTVVHADVSLGSFVEVKNSELGERTQVNHLSYVGDADVGAGVNVGAGTVTVNYDGRDKHRTVIGDGAFIGSGSMLIAPRTIGKGALTGAGSVVTHDVPPGERVAGVPARPLGERKARDLVGGKAPEPPVAHSSSGAPPPNPRRTGGRSPTAEASSATNDKQKKTKAKEQA